MDGSVLNDDSERPDRGIRTAAVLRVARTSSQPTLWQRLGAPPADPDELWLDKARVLEEIPNTPRDRAAPGPASHPLLSPPVTPSPETGRGRAVRLCRRHTNAHRGSVPLTSGPVNPCASCPVSHPALPP